MSTVGSSSTPGPGYHYEPLEEEITSPAAFLLPSLHRGSPTPRSKRPSRRILLVVVITLLSTSVGVACTIAWSRHHDSQDANAEAAFYLSPPPTATPPPSIAWLSSPAAATNLGVVPFSSANFSPLLPLRPLAITDSIRPFSPICLDLWISKGTVCESLFGRWAEGNETLEVDVIWTWSNGSQNELMSEWRDQASDDHTPPSLFKRVFAALTVATVAAQFR